MVTPEFCGPGLGPQRFRIDGVRLARNSVKHGAAWCSADNLQPGLQSCKSSRRTNKQHLRQSDIYGAAPRRRRGRLRLVTWVSEYITRAWRCVRSESSAAHRVRVLQRSGNVCRCPYWAVQAEAPDPSLGFFKNIKTTLEINPAKGR